MKNQLLIYGGVAILILIVVSMILGKLFKRSPEKQALKETKQKIRKEKKLSVYNLQNAPYSSKEFLYTYNS